MANFFFYRYHFVQLDEPYLFSEAEEGVTDFDERHNPRFAGDMAMNADGIGKLNLFNFKVDKKTGEQTSVQYENDILHCLDGVVMLQVRNNTYAHGYGRERRLAGFGNDYSRSCNRRSEVFRFLESRLERNTRFRIFRRIPCPCVLCKGYVYR